MEKTIQVVYMIVYIHVPKNMKKKLLLRYIVSHMEIDCKEQKAPKMVEHYSRNHNRLGQWIMKPP
jgi:hypothetical protein